MLSAVRAGQSVVFSSWPLDTGRSGSWAANPSLRDTVACGFGSEAGVLHLPPALVGTLCEVGGDKSEGFGLRPDSEVWSKLFPFLDITFSLCDTRRLDR